jgi:hypothetical protein
MPDLDLSMLAPVAGIWRFQSTTARYEGPQEGKSPFGLALTSARLRSGIVRATVTFESAPSVGRLVLGYNAETGAYFSVGIGGYDRAYLIDEFVPGSGWRAVRIEGSAANLSGDTEYNIEVRFKGQSVRLFVNGTLVLAGSFPHPATGDQIGLFAWGTTPVKFEKVGIDTEEPQAFVVMHFGEPYDSLYSEVIKPVAEKEGFRVYRGDDIHQPGVVLQDIVTGIVESDVIIAEITPPNPNVFYEIGFAHAMNKPTILLAERGRELPFDIRSYRCIFYDDRIRGKSGVEAALRKHLQSINSPVITPGAGSLKFGG